MRVDPGHRNVVTHPDGPLKSLFGIFERETKDEDRAALLLTAVNYQCRVVIERELVKKVG